MTSNHPAVKGGPMIMGGSMRSNCEASTPKTLAVISAYAWSIPHLEGFFPEASLKRWSGTPSAGGVAVWGNGTGARLVDRLARTFGRPSLKLEDGFLRSVGLAKNGIPPVSIIVDDIGLHLDAARPSRLEALVGDCKSAQWQAAGAEARARVVRSRMSKYNMPSLPQAAVEKRDSKACIVLVDQVRGDNSIGGALANETAFEAMRNAAMQRDATIVVRQHPDVRAGHRKGHLDPREGWLVSYDGDSHDVLDIADEVWTVSSQLGFEALLRGIPVVTYGMSFYSGYGLTEDRAEGAKADAARKRRGALSASLDQFVAAALLRYPRYVDPASGRRLSFNEAVDLLLDMRSRSKSP